MLTTTTPQEFIEQSLLLISAHPATTRTTTTYSSSSTVPGAATALPTKVDKKIKRKKVPTLKLKTYDPVTGATIVFKTDKAADVGRVFTALGKVARGMVGLKQEEEGQTAKTGLEGKDPIIETTDIKTEEVIVDSTGQLQAKGQGSGGGGGKGKKKKGKR